MAATLFGDGSLCYGGYARTHRFSPRRRLRSATAVLSRL